MAAAGKLLRGGCHLLALTGTTSAPRISHTEGRCLCEMRGAEVVPVSASKWQPPRRSLPAAAICPPTAPEKGYAVQRLPREAMG